MIFSNEKLRGTTSIFTIISLRQDGHLKKTGFNFKIKKVDNSFLLSEK